MEFKNGDLVRLRSGGPVMTVAVDDDRAKVICVWFDVQRHLQIGSFWRHVLLEADEADD